MTKKEIIVEICKVANINQELPFGKAEFIRQRMLKSRKEWLESAYELTKNEGKSGARYAIFVATKIHLKDICIYPKYCLYGH